MENISNFLEACKVYGVKEISCFQTVDLYENKQCYKVIECLRSLAAVVGQMVLSSIYISLDRPKAKLNLERAVSL